MNAGQRIDRFQLIPIAAKPAPSTIEALFKKQTLCQVEAGATLFYEGDSASHLFEVVQGVLRIFKIIGDGRRVITGFLYPGDLVGVSLKDRYLYSAEAVTDLRFRRFGRREFQDAVNASLELRPELFARLCDEMAAAQNQMVLLSRKNAEERVCSFLLEHLRREQRTCPNASIIELPMTRLDIADYLGLTIETVSRTFTKLMSRGLIAPEGRHALRVVRARGLARLTGGEYEDDNDFPMRSRHN
ncbi:helix-turn-helix domain-containing protein [Rhizobium sp. P32RR-XVIII]|nr:helix-turn-helix domain-containing protein [Rhizobium sp. P32RR-XVIII]